MDFTTLMYEKKALADFWKEEEHLKSQANRKWWNDTLRVNVFALDSDKETASEDESDDASFEGGSRQSMKKSTNGSTDISANFQKKNKKEQGYMQKLFGKGSSMNYNAGLQRDWEDMDEEERKLRIEYLWNKARRYINRLMLQARLQKMAE